MERESGRLDAQMKRGLLEYVVLSLLRGGDKYSSDILETLKTHDFIVVEWTLYPLLSRLKNDGHVSYYWKESLAWPPRKYFRITDEGGRFFEELDHAWKNLSRIIDSIITSSSVHD